MSTLKVDNIRTDNIKNTNGNDSPIDVPGAAKAWIVFDGTSSNIGTGAASYNIAGVTDHAAGDYTLTFTNAFPNTNYGYVITGNNPSAGGQQYSYGFQSHVGNVLGGSRHTASSLRFTTGWFGYQSAPGQQDLNPLTIVIYGP